MIEACDAVCFSELIKKRSLLSKGKDIHYSKLEIKTYFKSGSGLSSHDMHRIYSLRARSLPLKCNTPSQHSDTLCLARDCGGEDREFHIYGCELLTDGNEVTQNDTKYEDIFENNINKQKHIMTRFFERYERRSKLLPSNDGPVAPQGVKLSGSRGTRKKNKIQTRST